MAAGGLALIGWGLAADGAVGLVAASTGGGFVVLALGLRSLKREARGAPEDAQEPPAPVEPPLEERLRLLRGKALHLLDQAEASLADAGERYADAAQRLHAGQQHPGPWDACDLEACARAQAFLRAIEERRRRRAGEGREG